TSRGPATRRGCSTARSGRQAHAEQRGSGLRRQLRISLRNLEQRGVLLAELDMPQLPENRRALPALWFQLAIAPHRDAFTAKPERAGDASCGDVFLDRIPRRHDSVDGFLAGRSAQQIGVAEE